MANDEIIKEEKKVLKKVKGFVVSRLNHPVTLQYNEYATIIPPRGKSGLIEKEKLGALPKGCFFIKC